MSITVLIFLAITFAAIVFIRLSKMGTLLAFLLTGILVGQHVFGFVEMSESWNLLGELGIIFLWFTIGLQINLNRLWQMRKTIFGFGAAQVLMVAVMMFPILSGLTDWSVFGTCIIALMLAMSSTSEDLQILIDRNQLQTNTGRQAFSILLFQDLLSIPLLATLPILSGKAINLGATAIDIAVMSVGLVIAVFIVSKFIVNPLMKLVSKLKSKEAFMLAIVLNIAGWTYVLSLTGLTPALGAFLAGMLLSDTIYNQQIKISTEPFAAVFLGLFFIVLGMQLNLPFLGEHWLFILCGVLALAFIKFMALYMVARVRHVEPKDATLLSLILAQGGEFGLLILQTMKTNNMNAIPSEHVEILMAIIIASIILTPILLVIHDLLVKRGIIFVKHVDSKLSKSITEDAPQVFICGFGRMGQIIAQLLTAENISYVATDLNVDNVVIARDNGYNVIYGDATNPEILISAGFKQRKTKCIVVALDNIAISHRLIETLKEFAPHTKIVARAHNLKDTRELLKLGANFVTPEIIESSFLLGANVLEKLGVSKARIGSMLNNLRENNYTNIPQPLDTK